MFICPSSVTHKIIIPPCLAGSGALIFIHPTRSTRSQPGSPSGIWFACELGRRTGMGYGACAGPRAAEAAFRAASRRHLARFDRLAPVRCQTRLLLGLIHQAQPTRFGRDHDFRRIRTVADFRRLVPLCTRADLWRQYGQPAAMKSTDHENNGADRTPSPCLPIAWPSLHAAHRRALGTALCWSFSPGLDLGFCPAICSLWAKRDRRAPRNAAIYPSDCQPWCVPTSGWVRRGRPSAGRIDP